MCPIVADIHFHYRRAIEAAEAGAACLRINPGNIGSAERVKEVVKAARDHGCSIRIGVNAGSLERHLLEKYGEPNPEALVESALWHAAHLQDNDFHEFKISVKASRRLPGRRRLPAVGRGLRPPAAYRHHRGGREAHRHGEERDRPRQPALGRHWRHPAGLAVAPSRRRRCMVGWEMLKSLGLRHRGVKIISCPSCARQGFDVIRTVETLEDRLAHIADADHALASSAAW